LTTDYAYLENNLQGQGSNIVDKGVRFKPNLAFFYPDTRKNAFRVHDLFKMRGEGSLTIIDLMDVGKFVGAYLFLSL
jgi:hypothetical protein